MEKWSKTQLRTYYLVLGFLWLALAIMPILGLQIGNSHYPALVNYLSIGVDCLISGIYFGLLIGMRYRFENKFKRNVNKDG